METKESLRRSTAIAWWNTNNLVLKQILSQKFFERSSNFLTDKEIELIWLKETQEFIYKN